MVSCYLEEQARIEEAYNAQQTTWEYVRDSEGHILHIPHGMLMVSNHGDYACDTGFKLVCVDNLLVKRLLQSLTSK